MGAYFKLTASHRAAIEDQIESLIAMLDAFDGDPDMEDDDPAGDDLDERGEMPSDDGQPISAMRPIYAVDQTAGPTNAKAAYQAHCASELGLVRSATGGWRWAS